MFVFEEVPPPTEAPIQSRAEELRLPNGLRVEKSREDSSPWRCDCCNKLQRPGSEEVWVPDGIQKKDSAWSVSETARAYAYNGRFSAWCLSCVSHWAAKPVVIPPLNPLTFWQRIKSRFAGAQ